MSNDIAVIEQDDLPAIEGELVMPEDETTYELEPVSFDGPDVATAEPVQALDITPAPELPAYLSDPVVPPQALEPASPVEPLDLGLVEPEEPAVEPVLMDEAAPERQLAEIEDDEPMTFTPTETATAAAAGVAAGYAVSTHEQVNESWWRRMWRQRQERKQRQRFRHITPKNAPYWCANGRTAEEKSYAGELMQQRGTVIHVHAYEKNSVSIDARTHA